MPLFSRYPAVNRLRPFLYLLAVFVVAACAARDEIVVVPARADATLHDVLYATNRAPNNRLFGDERSSVVSYGQIQVSVPSSHKLGVVEYPDKNNANPQSEFGIVEASATTETTGFARILQNQIDKRAAGKRTAIVYVHGFNNSFAEALYMNTQLLHDYGRKDIPVLFSWPSAGENLAYLHDRDSVMLSRSALESLLDQLEASDLEGFFIVGHSIGSQLIVEALRQHAIRNDGDQWSKLSGVMLVAPDIDVDLFEQQMVDMGGVPEPFFVVASENDRLLALSGIISGSAARLGAVDDPVRYGVGNATLMSATFASDIWSVNHTTAFTSPEMIAFLRSYNSTGD